MFEVLADGNRRLILDLLRQEERPVGDLVAALGISQPGVSKHLRILREAGLVGVHADAQRRVYRLRPEPLREVDAWLPPYRAAWSDRLDALATACPTEEAPVDQRDLGTLDRDGDGWVVTFTRRVPHPVEKGWRAVTEAEHLAAWFPQAIVGDRRAGAKLRFVTDGDDGFDPSARRLRAAGLGRALGRGAPRLRGALRARGRHRRPAGLTASVSRPRPTAARRC